MMKIYPRYDINHFTLEMIDNSYKHLIELECKIRILAEDGKYYLIDFKEYREYRTKDASRLLDEDIKCIEYLTSSAYLVSQFHILNENTIKQSNAKLDSNQETERKRLLL